MNSGEANRSGRSGSDKAALGGEGRDLLDAVMLALLLHLLLISWAGYGLRQIVLPSLAQPHATSVVLQLPSTETPTANPPPPPESPSAREPPPPEPAPEVALEPEEESPEDPPPDLVPEPEDVPVPRVEPKPALDPEPAPEPAPEPELRTEPLEENEPPVAIPEQPNPEEELPEEVPPRSVQEDSASVARPDIETVAGKLDRPPTPVRAIRPSYPLGARQRGEEGAVEAEIEVRPDGRVEEVRILRGSGYGALDRAAVQALRKARFTPARRGRETVRARVRLTVVFKLTE